jgi:L-Ala-D/L-Glu epimerase
MSTITTIEVFQVSLPFERPFTIALGVMKSAEHIIIRIHDSDGLVGVGEGVPARFVTGEAPETAFTAAQLYAKLLVGKNPLEIEACLSEMSVYMLKNPATFCAFDMALYDLLAKHANLPLYALFGGRKQTIISNRTIGIDTPGGMANTAKRYVDNGVQSLKLKVGSGQDKDVACVRAVREVVPSSVAIRLDANQAWDKMTALNILNAIADCNVQVCEQPLPFWDFDGLKHLCERSPVAIMADESIFDAHDAFRLAQMRAVDYFNIKLAKSGGLNGALKINAIGEAAGIPCMLGGMSESLIGVSAGAHLVCACPNITLHDLDSPFHFVENPVLGGVDFDPDGTITLSVTPGHGADLKPEWREKSRRAVITAGQLGLD